MSRFLIVIATVAANLIPVMAAEVTFQSPEMILDASSYYYPSPVYEDLDDDGNPELMIGDLRGHLTIYKNQGSEEAPEWGDQARLTAGGEDLQLPNW